MKKIFSLALAAVFVLALACVAIAEDNQAADAASRAGETNPAEQEQQK